MDSPSKDLMTVVKQSAYPLEAFLFVQRGLDFTVRSIHGEMEDGEEAEVEVAVEMGDPSTHSRHVSGRQLCHGLRDFAISEYGLLARTMLRRWKVRSCEDFGQIVFAMVEGGLMHKTDEDSIDDFRGVFDFASAFEPSLSLSGEARG